MNWNSWSDFFAMGGYALYVWGSVLMTVLLVAGELLALRVRRSSMMKLYGRWVRSNRRESNESEA
ncbi:MAG TPA: heme exporter protein CcmD [Noviherbaspirillum sp.]|nr:heme exporter protein CcmD [Noviherbaspirillum sp.]